MQTVLTIAGFDPSSGAGITADLMVFAAHSLFGTSCITSLTVQSTRGVHSSHPIDPSILLSSLRYLAEDLQPAGIKIGMLGTAATVEAVSTFLAELRTLTPRTPIVFDPVLHSSSGRELLDQDGVSLLRSRVLPLVDWVTPNLEELAILSGLPTSHREDVLRAGTRLQALSQAHRTSPTVRSLYVIATAGDLTPPDDLMLSPDGEPVWLPGEHIQSASTHGTGCAFSSALLSRLVLGDSPHIAALSAKHYVAEAIRSAPQIGSGKGPLNHLWPLERSKRSESL